MSLQQSTYKYKLTYFNFRSLAEPIRYLLSYVGEDFQDVRIEMDDWMEGKVDKTRYPFGMLPILEERLDNGDIVELTQSFSIVVYLGRKYKLVGENLLEEAKCDAYSDCMKELNQEVAVMYSTEDEKKQSELRTILLTKTIPRYFSVFEKDLSKNKKLSNMSGTDGVIPLVGKNLTWIDFLLAHYAETFEEFLNETKKSEAGQELLLDEYPMIKQHQEGIFALEKISEWRKKRPVTKY